MVGWPVYPRLRGSMTASTSAYNTVGGGPSAPQAREPSLFASRH